MGIDRATFRRTASRRLPMLWPITAAVLLALTVVHWKARQEPVLPADHASVTVEVEGLHCRVWCPIRIGGALESLDGYYRSHVDVDHGLITVLYDASELGPDAIRSALSSGGYHALDDTGPAPASSESP